MIIKRKSPYIRDVYLAYLISGARRTKTDEYPIIEKWMVATEPPKDIIQWDCRRDIANEENVAISFYCNDYTFAPILNNPKKYTDKLKKYAMVIGLDASPYDNMPIVVQKSQIFLNLAITFYYGLQGIKIIPNVRVGDMRTLTSLEAYPKGTLIAIGTNGFVKKVENRGIFRTQLELIIKTLEPSGICVYGSIPDEIFSCVKLRNIPIYQYDSYAMKENFKYKKKFVNEEKKNEG